MSEGNSCYPYYGNRGYQNGLGLEELMLANQMANGHQQLGEKIHHANVDGIRETADAARDTVDAIRDSIDATNQIGNINLQSTERNGGETRTVTERAAGTVRDAISVESLNNARNQAILVGEICDVRKEASDNAGKTWLEMAKQHGEIKLEMCKQHSELQRQADLNAAAAAKALADCCCELKEQHAVTRQLIQQTALDDCNRRAGDLQNEVNLLRINASMKGQGNSN